MIFKTKQNLSIFNVEKPKNIAQNYPDTDFKGTIVNQECSSFNRDYLKITLIKCLNEFVRKLHRYCCID